MYAQSAMGPLSKECRLHLNTLTIHIYLYTCMKNMSVPSWMTLTLKSSAYHSFIVQAWYWLLPCTYTLFTQHATTGELIRQGSHDAIRIWIQRLEAARQVWNLGLLDNWLITDAPRAHSIFPHLWFSCFRNSSFSSFVSSFNFSSESLPARRKDGVRSQGRWRKGTVRYTVTGQQ